MKFRVGEMVQVKVNGSPYLHHQGKIGTIIERKERLERTGINKSYKIKIDGYGEWGYTEESLKRLS